MRPRSPWNLRLGTTAILLVTLGSAYAGQWDASESPLLARPRDRVAGVVDDQQRTPLVGSRHPLARPEYETGAVSPDVRMEHMILMLKPDSAQQKALDDLVAAQNNPESPYYHQWLTPESYGHMFGLS